MWVKPDPIVGTFVPYPWVLIQKMMVCTLELTSRPKLLMGEECQHISISIYEFCEHSLEGCLYFLMSSVILWQVNGIMNRALKASYATVSEFILILT